MRLAWTLALLLAAPGLPAGQAEGVLHISVTLRDAAQGTVPVLRHALLVSDNPSTREPRRVLTGPDGTVALRLRPGSYTVESDRPVRFLGQAYQWTQIIDVAAGRETVLVLDTANADIVSTDTGGTVVDTTPGRNASLPAAAWRGSVVAVWSPTRRATGFLVDARGLIATFADAVGVEPVAVQVSPAVKVPGRALVADPATHAGVVWVDPSVLGTASPLPLACPASSATSLDERHEILTLATSLHGGAEPEWGVVTGLQARVAETDLRVPFGGVGGPVFNEAGVVVGLTAPGPARDRPERDLLVVRLAGVCDAVAAARAAMSASAPPPAARLPVEPPASAAAPTPERGTGTTARTPPAAPLLASTVDFDVALLTPPMVASARLRDGWTGGRTGRAPEVEARLGALTDFGTWSEYFADVPPVLIVRVTPKLVEGFWKRLAREAARTQGARLPAFKDFRTSFLGLHAACGATAVTPIQPFVLEHHLEERAVVREGLYVFAPEAFGPHCGRVTLSIRATTAPKGGDTLTVDPKVVDRIQQDFVAWRSGTRP